MLVVVGGHSRNLGKTSVVSGLIRNFHGFKWTAVKITQYGHGVCSHVGEACGCETEAEHPFALSEEFEPGPSDSARFLAAGAKRSFWLRTPMGELARAQAMLHKILAQNPNVIIESNSVLELVRPDLFLMVLDFSCRDFKASSLRFMDRADAFLVVDSGINVPVWEGVARGIWDGKPQFPISAPEYLSSSILDFVRSRLSLLSPRFSKISA